MSVKRIIQESIDKNPLGVKEALEEALQDRVRAALEEKYKKMAMKEEDDEEDEDEDDEDEDMDESFDLSDYTAEELEDFIISEDFDQLDEETQDYIAYYYEALTPEQRKAREANRKGGRLGKHDPEAREFFHNALRGKKGAERTAMGRDPVSGSFLTKHGRADMSKIGKHGAAGGGSSFKPNRETALTKARILNQRMNNKSGMVSGDKYGKSKLPK